MESDEAPASYAASLLSEPRPNPTAPSATTSKAVQSGKTLKWPRDPDTRYSFCSKPGRLEADCRKRQKAIADLASNPTEQRNNNNKNNKSKQDKTKSAATIGSLIDTAFNTDLIIDTYPKDSISSLGNIGRSASGGDDSITVMVDSGYTSHAFVDRNAFSHYQQLPANNTGDRKFVTTAGNAVLRVAGTRTVNILVLQPDKTRRVRISLHNVNHVPALRNNYFSVSAASYNGISTHFDDSVRLYLSSSRQLIAAGERTGNLYYNKRRLNC